MYSVSYGAYVVSHFTRRNMSTTDIGHASTRPRPHPRRIHSSGWTPRTASLISGVGLAIMAMLAAAANFGAIGPLIAPSDAVATAAAIGNNQIQFLAGIIALFIVTILDVIVAAAWYVLFAPVNRTVSAIAAWARVSYAVGFMVAISQLVIALATVDEPQAALAATQSFTAIWVSVLGIFGVHLLLVGYLAFRSGFMARIFGILLALAGAGYIADAIGALTVPGFEATFASFLFIGEVAVIFWLFIRGRRLPG